MVDDAGRTCFSLSGLEIVKRMNSIPLNEMTIETMKKPTATIATDSRHVKPIAIIPLANCHVAALLSISFYSIFVYFV